MTNATTGRRTSWGARLLIALSLILLGAIAAAWGLARYDPAARLFGIAPAPPQQAAGPRPTEPAQLRFLPPQAQQAPVADAAEEGRIQELEERVEQVESTAREVGGSAGRADALLIAFAARRAIDRGVALGYLEPLLIERFGRDHPQATSAIVSSSRTPVRLSDLQADYEALAPVLRSPAADAGFWNGIRREIGTLISVRRSDRPSTRPEARYARSLDLLRQGEVDKALAETMRLPAAGRADNWIRKARHYVATQRALDEIEASALVGRTARPDS